MTIEKARELLGNYSMGLSDMEVLELNRQSKSMCEALLSIIINDCKKETLALTAPE